MKEDIKKKIQKREDKLVLDTNYPIGHKINKAIIKKYLNPNNCNHVGNKFFTNRISNLPLFNIRIPIGGKDKHQQVRFPIGSIETKKGLKTIYSRDTKLIKHYR